MSTIERPKDVYGSCWESQRALTGILRAQNWTSWHMYNPNLSHGHCRPSATAVQMRRLLGHVTVASEHLATLMLQHAYLAASQQLSRQSPALSPTERGERLMSAVIALGELADTALCLTLKKPICGILCCM